jgi:molybdate transport system substrate-binding protein
MKFMLAMVLVLSSLAAQAAELQVIAGGAFAGPLKVLAGQFEASSGHKVVIRYGTTPELIDMARTTPFDFAVTPAEVFRNADAAAKMPPGPLAPIARVGLGVAVPAGAPKPDVSTRDTLKQALLSARSIATVPASAAGVQVMKLFDELGVATEVKPKLVVATGPTELVASLAARKAELGIFLINVLTANGLDVLGPVPAALNREVTYVAGVASNTKQAEIAKAFLSLLQSPDAKTVIKAHGLTPG